MQFTQMITRSSLAAVALLNLSVASAIATPIVVTRGPNGAAHVVKSDNIPVDAQVPPTTEANAFPVLTQKGPGGASHVVKQDQKAAPQPQAKGTTFIRRGNRGAFAISNQ